MPTEKPWKTYMAWAKELNSELMSVWTFGQLMIVINSPKAARELLRYRSANYGDRPRVPIFVLAGLSDTFTSFMPYGERWRAHRRFMHRKFNMTAVSAYQPMQEVQVRPFLRRLQQEPDKAREHVEHFTTALGLMVAYGHHISEGSDRIVDLTLKGGEIVVNSMLPSAAIINAVPALKYLPEWLPGTTFHAFARRSRKLFSQVREEPYNEVKALAKFGKAPPSFTRSILDQIGTPSPSDESVIKEVASMVYFAGAETSLCAIRTVILALALHPHVQHRAQAVLDAKIGRGRLPTCGDKDALPYIEAIVRETLRWSPVTPLGVLRNTINDDVYEGMHIPAGTTITWNAWAMTHDPEAYQEPDAFCPERYLDESGQLAFEEDPSIFGYGRRECVGMHLARSTLFLVTASMLSVFDIVQAKDKNGSAIEINADFTDGFVSHPKNYACSFLPRDSQAVKLLEELKS